MRTSLVIALLTLLAATGNAFGQVEGVRGADAVATDAASDNLPISEGTRDATAAPTRAPYPNAPRSIDEEREEIWNSPEMLRARAWLKEYTSRSKKVKPEQAKEYMTELENLTPAQMRLWLLNFEEQQEWQAQQQAAFEAARRTSVDYALGMQRQTRQAETQFNREQTVGAQMAQQSMIAQHQSAQQRGAELSMQREAAATEGRFPSSYAWLDSSPWGPYAGYPLGGPDDPGARFGHYHIHYHAAPVVPQIEKAPGPSPLEAASPSQQ
jgi:hypothetical protein